MPIMPDARCPMPTFKVVARDLRVGLGLFYSQPYSELLSKFHLFYLPINHPTLLFLGILGFFF
jgi:hypothetical protein